MGLGAGRRASYSLGTTDRDAREVRRGRFAATRTVGGGHTGSGGAPARSRAGRTAPDRGGLHAARARRAHSPAHGRRQRGLPAAGRAPRYFVGGPRALLRHRRAGDAADPRGPRAEARRGEARRPRPEVGVESRRSPRRSRPRYPRAPSRARRARRARSAAGADRGAALLRRTDGGGGRGRHAAVAGHRPSGRREREVLAGAANERRVMDARPWESAKQLLAEVADLPAAVRDTGWAATLLPSTF